MLTAGAMLVGAGSAAGARVTAASQQHMALNCEYANCAEVANSAEVFGSQYVGHDEPSNLFYSSKPGSGNQMRYLLRLPKDPSPSNPASKSYQFELNGSFWFGMAMCDTQSYPEQVSTCPADSDSNILDPAVSPAHSGSAFMEMQFYPPGWIPWPTWAVALGANGCDPTKWCAAMNIFSLSENPVTGQFQNDTCAAATGIEYANFAFITKNGVSQAPANPAQSTLTTFTPDPAKDLFMNSGDVLALTMHDTANGLNVAINDLSSGQSGSMTASAANGFAQIQFAPNPSTACNAIPYNFHPMYSTSSEQTRVIWAAHTYNVGFSSEIGHFENCNGPTPVPATPFGVDSSGNPITCPAGNNEGLGAGTPTDGDDVFCFPGTEAMLVHITGCTGQNNGFDNMNYQPDWPDGNTAIHPEPVLFTSPRTGGDYLTTYSRTAFEADLPRVENPAVCDRTTGNGCTLIPTTDKPGNPPAAFYPFFSAFQSGISGVCAWAFGNTLPGANNFGENNQYGTLLTTDYLRFGGGGATINRVNNFRQVFSTNPC